MEKKTAADASKIESSKVQGAFDQSLMTAGPLNEGTNTFMQSATMGEHSQITQTAVTEDNVPLITNQNQQQQYGLDEM